MEVFFRTMETNKLAEMVLYLSDREFYKNPEGESELAVETK